MVQGLSFRDLALVFGVKGLRCRSWDLVKGG